MDYTFDKLKRSFDNILKELDDICKSIDNLNDFEQGTVSSKPPISDKNSKCTEPKNSNLFRKCRLPDDKETTPLLSNIIGSAQECTAKLFMNEKKSLPMATKESLYTNQDFSHTDSACCRKVEDEDFLAENERLKIASFYNSMNCFVYVSRCTAELYELKREDELDSIDSDPVKDYYLFLKNRQNLAENDDEESKPIVNFMYINSGVPVLIFNSGLANYKIRKKDVRIVLAERSTAFCMYEFKFDCLTEFENSEYTSVFRLSQVNTKAHFSPNSAMNLNYQNEFFEKFFNVKKKNFFKEHFLKFCARDSLDEFYSNVKKILTDKKNPSYHHNTMGFRSKVNSSCQLNEMNEKPRQSHYKSNNSLNSVTSIIDTYQTIFAKQISSIDSPSLIMCHFGSDAVPESRTKSGRLRANASFASLDTDKLTRSPKLIKQCSLSSNDVVPFKFDRNKYTLRRQNTNATCLAETKSNFSKSIINLDDSKFFDSGKNLFRSFLIKNRKLKKSDISDPVNFSHVSHLDKPVAIGKRYKLDY